MKTHDEKEDMKERLDNMKHELHDGAALHGASSSAGHSALVQEKRTSRNTRSVQSESPALRDVDVMTLRSKPSPAHASQKCSPARDLLQ